MKTLHTEWQTRWREILGESTSDMPSDVNCDFALHIDIWQLEANKQKECFSLFPNGLKMLERATEVRSIVQKKPVSNDEELLRHLDKINVSVERVLSRALIQKSINWNEEKKLCPAPVVFRGDSQLKKKLLGKSCSPTIPLDRILRELFERQFGEIGLATYSFLCEPFYQVADDTYIQDSIFWPALQDEYGEDPYESVIELHNLSAKAGWDENDHEMFVFIEE